MNERRLGAGSLLMVAALLISSQPSRGADVYLLAVYAQEPTEIHEGYQVGQSWIDEQRFHNSGQATATVRLLEMSNGATPGGPTSFEIPAGATRPGIFFPTIPAPYLIVEHLDVPSQIAVSSRLDFYRNVSCVLPCGGPSLSGWLHLPVIRSLTPAGQEQILLDADLGDALPSRLRVALYDGAAVDGNAAIELRSGCDDQIVQASSYPIPAKSAVIVEAFDSSLDDGCDQIGSLAYSAFYLRVVMDQPGFAVLSATATGYGNFTIPAAISGPD
jgi:hypothetical protein